MKPYPRTVARLAALFFSAALLLAGCASLGMRPAAPPGATIQTVEDDYRQAQLQVAATQDALDGMVVSADLDLRQSFDYFTSNLAMMEQIGKRLVAHADGMFYRGSYYFVESGKSLEACAFPRSGRTDNQRGVDLGESFYLVSESGGAVKRGFRAFQFDIEQIHDYLAGNLTPVGIDTLEQILRKAKVDSDSLEKTLRQAQTTLERAKTTLAQQAPRKG